MEYQPHTDKTLRLLASDAIRLNAKSPLWWRNTRNYRALEVYCELMRSGANSQKTVDGAQERTKRTIQFNVL
jgi:hypothetical protein